MPFLRATFILASVIVMGRRGEKKKKITEETIIFPILALVQEKFALSIPACGTWCFPNIFQNNVKSVAQVNYLIAEELEEEVIFL